MYVGGLSFNSSGNSSCQTAEPVLYDFTCFRWIAWNDLPSKLLTKRMLSLRYGHTATKFGDNRLLIMGGLHGSFSNDLEALQLPSDIPSYNPVPSCHERHDKVNCSAAVQCLWCDELLNSASSGAPAQCIPTVMAESVCYRASESPMTQCRDLCSLHYHCTGCLKWRTGVSGDSAAFCSFCPSHDYTPSCRRATMPRKHCSTPECAVDEDGNTLTMRVIYTEPNGRTDTIITLDPRVTFRNPVNRNPAERIVVLRNITVGSANKSCHEKGEQCDRELKPATVQASVTCAKGWLSAGYVNSEQVSFCPLVIDISDQLQPYTLSELLERYLFDS